MLTQTEEGLFCKRNHNTTILGLYISPSGAVECAECKKQRNAKYFPEYYQSHRNDPLWWEERKRKMKDQMKERQLNNTTFSIKI